MATHKPFERGFFPVLGNPAGAGTYSLKLKEGEFGIFNMGTQTKDGVPAIVDFSTLTEKDKKTNSYELKLGVSKLGKDGNVLPRSFAKKSFSSFPFKIKDVIGLSVSVPERESITADELTIGYDGTDPSTSIKLVSGEHREMFIELSGKALEYIAAPEGKLRITVPLTDVNVKPFSKCDPNYNECAPAEMTEIINRAVAYLNGYSVYGVPFTHFAEATAVISGENFGIKIKGKTFNMQAGEALRGKINYVEDGVKIQASGGYVVDRVINTSRGLSYDTPWKVTYQSRYKPRTHVYGNTLANEVANRTFFTGISFNHNYLGRLLSGDVSSFTDLDAQFVQYNLTLRRDIYSQSMSQRLEENITYQIHVKVGEQASIEGLLNGLATAAGLETVKADVGKIIKKEEAKTQPL